jgi:hypothetical protein
MHVSLLLSTVMFEAPSILCACNEENVEVTLILCNISDLVDTLT